MIIHITARLISSAVLCIDLWDVCTESDMLRMLSGGFIWETLESANQRLARRAIGLAHHLGFGKTPVDRD